MPDPLTDAGLRQRLEGYLRSTQMGYTERFEEQAERFYRETGFMAPGKSQPLEMEVREERREEAWRLWQEQQREQYQQDLRSALAAVDQIQPGAAQEPDALLQGLCNAVIDNEALADLQEAEARAEAAERRLQALQQRVQVVVQEMQAEAADIEACGGDAAPLWELREWAASLTQPGAAQQPCRFRDGRCTVCGEPESGMCNGGEMTQPGAASPQQKDK